MFYVYITASGRNGTIYTGSTDDIRARIEQHKAKRFSGFTARYGADRLVWLETHPSRDEAFRRERQIKEWRRLWKLQLIEGRNPNWIDLSADLDRWLQEDEQRASREFLPGSRLSPG
ncbi:MAG: GIY-YIG nuclease family protein [Caulobacteraceae bacterium]|nr:GIY-YIG nuclease family protein [Caulobacteraceae bacterium]